MGAISATDIISIIQSEIENFDFDTESRETGEVIYVGDGIATIYGIDHAMYGEIVVFDNGVSSVTVRQERHQLPQIQSSTRRARMLSVYM